MKLWKYAYLLNHDEQLKIETFGYALKHSLHKIPLENVRVIDKSEDKIKMETVLLHLLIYLMIKYLYEVKISFSY